MKEAQQSMVQELELYLRGCYGRIPEKAQPADFWFALSHVVMGRMAERWTKSRQTYWSGRMSHYLSAEFLVGRSLLNNLVNLGLYERAKEVLASFGQNLDDILEEENDAALGNGGLGRLAACFLDSCATENLPVNGYGILYRYGLFRQSFDNGFQKEHPDTWMEDGYPFTLRRPDEAIEVQYADMKVIAIPYDMPISGYGTQNINTLRLWCAEPAEEFDYNLFNSQRFDDAVIEKNRSEDIWRVLYPNDTTYDGKVLRVRQQYFFVSASLQDCIRKFKAQQGTDLRNFADYHCFQLNDTHPVVGIAELMRLLMDEEGLSWEDAWTVCQKAFAYTNHTILAEALEKWDVGIFQFLFPRILEIIREIDRRFRLEMEERGLRKDRIDYMAPLGNGQVRMAWLACYAAFSINGVAALHTEILKRETLKEWYEIWPEKFRNKTNGVTPRRWLRMSNPELAALLTDCLGSEDWICDLERLKELDHLAENRALMKRLMEVKRHNKERLSKYLEQYMGAKLNPEAIFDVQVKRLHEYKRQLLNAFYILDLYYRIKENPDCIRRPRVFIFGAKSAPGYFRAKGIIKFINEVARLVASDPLTAEKIQVCFVPNYNVSNAELIIPAADISEQISTAGMEASGTGNMKFMMNGALTLGTYDGANVEIAEAAGEENCFIFGVRVEDFPATRAYYNPHWQYENIPGLKRVLDSLVDGTLNDDNSGMFQDLYNSLLNGSSWQAADPYYVLGDFNDYRICRDQAAERYEDQEAWAQMCWHNICNSGRFSSDRTIREYAQEIWQVEAKEI